MENNTNNVCDNIFDVAKQLNTRLQNELPILEDMLCAINETEDDIQLLPNIIHNVSVIDNANAYRFLEDSFELYNDLVSMERPSIINHDLWKALKKHHSVLRDLYNQETDEYKRQMSHYTQIVRKEIENDASLNFDTLMEEKKMEFVHVECDISSSINSFILLLIMGYEPTDTQIAHLKRLLSIAKELIEESINNKRTALTNIKTLVS